MRFVRNLFLTGFSFRPSAGGWRLKAAGCKLLLLLFAADAALVLRLSVALVTANAVVPSCVTHRLRYVQSQKKTDSSAGPRLAMHELTDLPATACRRQPATTCRRSPTYSGLPSLPDLQRLAVVPRQPTTACRRLSGQSPVSHRRKKPTNDFRHTSSWI